MKKLALALMCLVSVAFFASCDPQVENPEPAIQVLATEGYLQNGDVVDANYNYPFGFVVSSNVETNKELKSLVITVNDEEFDNVELSGDTYTYESMIGWVIEEREIVGEATIKAVVTDVDGQVNTATITVSINYEEPVEKVEYTWVRRGSFLQDNTQAEMAAVGLQWTGSYKDIFATIKPLNENTKMYIIEDALDKFNDIETVIDVENFFDDLKETSVTVSEYRKVSAEVNKTYNDILAVVDADGNYHLVLIGNAVIETGAFGTQITLKGFLK